MIRAAAAVAILVGTFYFVRREIEPLHCNTIVKQQEAAAQLALDSGRPVNPQTIALRARTNLDVINAAIRTCPREVGLYMVAAVNYRLIQRPQDAIRMYEAALTYDRRPEIYLQLGNTHAEAGNRDAALANLLLALRFRPEYLSAINSPQLQLTLSAEPYLSRWLRKTGPVTPP